MIAVDVRPQQQWVFSCSNRLSLVDLVIRVVGDSLGPSAPSAALPGNFLACLAIPVSVTLINRRAMSQASLNYQLLSYLKVIATTLKGVG